MALAHSCAVRSSSLGEAATATATATAVPTATSTTTPVACVSEIPQETAGPYPGDGSNGVNVLSESGVVRSDLTTSFGGASGVAGGVPTTVRLRVYDLEGEDVETDLASRRTISARLAASRSRMRSASRGPRLPI